MTIDRALQHFGNSVRSRRFNEQESFRRCRVRPCHRRRSIIFVESNAGVPSISGSIYAGVIRVRSFLSISAGSLSFSRSRQKIREQKRGDERAGKKEVKIGKRGSQRKKIGSGGPVHVPENWPPCRPLPPPPQEHVYAASHEISSVALFKLSCERSACSRACMCGRGRCMLTRIYAEPYA